MKGRPNSAQSQWLENPHVTWRSAFPLFATLWDSAGVLLAHEGRLLVLTAAGLTAATFGLVLVLAFFDPNWVDRSWGVAVQTWTLVAVGLVGAWTSLGRGDWHLRFPLGVLAAGWIAVVHVAAEAAVGGAFASAELCTRALATFALAAFGGAWLRSLGRFELAGPTPDGARPRLRLFQFSTASLFCFMLLTAIVLGLWQLVVNLEGRVYLKSFFLETADARGAVLLASASALTAFWIAFGKLKSAGATIVVLLVLLCVAESFAGSPFCPNWRRAVRSSFPHGVLATGAVSLGLALVPLVGLRLAGFHRQRTRAAE